VRHAAVFGVPDPQWVETVVAAIQVTPGRSVAQDALAQACREKLAPYKRPKHYFFVDEMPLTPAGKVQKFRLAEHFSPAKGT
jgi:fatty-acyl-CoA synthase